MTEKNPQKQGRILERGGKNFSDWPEYIPLYVCVEEICHTLDDLKEQNSCAV